MMTSFGRLDGVDPRTDNLIHRCFRKPFLDALRNCYSNANFWRGRTIAFEEVGQVAIVSERSVVVNLKPLSPKELVTLAEQTWSPEPNLNFEILQRMS